MDSDSEEFNIIIPHLQCITKEWRGTIISQIGEGTFGVVYLSEKDGSEFAVKSLNLNQSNENGFSLSMLREFKIMRQLDHKNILKIKDIATKGFKVNNYLPYNCKIYVVFDYFKSDLYKLLKKQVLEIAQVKYIFRQLVDGMNYLKDNSILHRDLKTANILVDKMLNVKIADFGLAKFSGEVNTPGLITLWYRPPEMLLGSFTYDYSADLWSLGCILAEMLLGRPLFQGDSEIVQLEAIIYLLGSINTTSMSCLEELPDYKKICLCQSISHFDVIFSKFDNECVNLIRKMLVLDPKNRIKIEDVKYEKFYCD